MVDDKRVDAMRVRLIKYGSGDSWEWGPLQHIRREGWRSQGNRRGPNARVWAFARDDERLRARRGTKNLHDANRAQTNRDRVQAKRGLLGLRNWRFLTLSAEAAQ